MAARYPQLAEGRCTVTTTITLGVPTKAAPSSAITSPQSPCCSGGPCPSCYTNHGSYYTCSDWGGCSYWSVYDYEFFEYNYSAVYDDGETNTPTGAVSVTWWGCSPSSSTTYIGCGSNFNWNEPEPFQTFTHYCSYQRIFAHTDGSVTYSPNPYSVDKIC